MEQSLPSFSKIKKEIESFNNASWKGYKDDVEKRTRTVYFDATVFAKNGISRFFDKPVELDTECGWWKIDFEY